MHIDMQVREERGERHERPHPLRQSKDQQGTVWEEEYWFREICQECEPITATDIVIVCVCDSLASAGIRPASIAGG